MGDTELYNILKFINVSASIVMLLRGGGRREEAIKSMPFCHYLIFYNQERKICYIMATFIVELGKEKNSKI